MIGHQSNIISKSTVNKDYIEPGAVIEFGYTGGTDPKPLVFILPEMDEVTGGGLRAKGLKLKKGGSFSGINLHFLNTFTVERLIQEKNLLRLSGWNMYKGAYRTYSLKKVKSIKLVDFRTIEETKIILEKDIKPQQPEPPKQPEKPEGGINED